MMPLPRTASVRIVLPSYPYIVERILLSVVYRAGVLLLYCSKSGNGIPPGKSLFDMMEKIEFSHTELVRQTLVVRCKRPQTVKGKKPLTEREQLILTESLRMCLIVHGYPLRAKKATAAAAATPRRAPAPMPPGLPFVAATASGAVYPTACR